MAKSTSTQIMNGIYLRIICNNSNNFILKRIYAIKLPVRIEFDLNMKISNDLPSLNRISLVTKTSISAHFAAIKSSGENTPKCAVPLLMRRKQSKRSDPMTHSIFDFASRIGQFLGAFLYVPRDSTKQTRTAWIQHRTETQKQRIAL